MSVLPLSPHWSDTDPRPLDRMTSRQPRRCARHLPIATTRFVARPAGLCLWKRNDGIRSSETITVQGHPDVVMADAGYDSEATRALLRWLGVEPKIRKSRAEHGSGLGKVRWVVERTISWLKGLRRLRIRYDRKGGSWTPGPAWRRASSVFACGTTMRPMRDRFCQGLLGIQSLITTHGLDLSSLSA